MSAVSQGFSIADFEYLTIGMVMDALSETIPDGERVYKATKEDYRKYL
jgi:hypothetical protein